jgi:hypothetical protein
MLESRSSIITSALAAWVTKHITNITAIIPFNNLK